MVSTSFSADPEFQSEIWRYSRHKIAEGDGRIVGKIHNMMEFFLIINDSR